MFVSSEQFHITSHPSGKKNTMNAIRDTRIYWRASMRKFPVIILVVSRRAHFNCCMFHSNKISEHICVCSWYFDCILNSFEWHLRATNTILRGVFNEWILILWLVCTNLKVTNVWKGMKTVKFVRLQKEWRIARSMVPHFVHFFNSRNSNDVRTMQTFAFNYFKCSHEHQTDRNAIWECIFLEIKFNFRHFILMQYSLHLHWIDVINSTHLWSIQHKQFCALA